MDTYTDSNGIKTPKRLSTWGFIGIWAAMYVLFTAGRVILNTI